MEDNKLSKAVRIVDVKNLTWFGSVIVAIMLSWNALNTQIVVMQNNIQQIIDQHKTIGATQQDLNNRMVRLETIFGIKNNDESANLK